MRFNKLCLFIFSIIYLSVIFSVSVYAESFYLHCNTAPELLEEATNTLIQKKITELNKNYNPWSDEIQLFQIGIGSPYADLMPSIGDVKMLVLPIEFADYKFDNDPCENLQEVFFQSKI